MSVCPAGQMGNSEVGHLNLGAGAVVKQDLARIDEAVANGTFFENEALVAACDAARRSPRGRLHLIGLVSDGGVHSGWEHIEALIELAAQEGVPDLVVHALTDGRDTLPTASRGYLEEVERWFRHAGRIGTVGGRFYGMDRDHRWERTSSPTTRSSTPPGCAAASAEEAVAEAAERGETDEFIRPTVIGDYDGVADGDVVIHFNFRPDRARQLVMALGERGFNEFDRGHAAGRSAHDADAVPRRLGVPGRIPAARARDDARRGARGRGRRAPAPRRRDREVRARHLLLQRRARGRSGRGRSARWSTRPATSRPTTTSREMSAAAAAAAFVARWSSGDYRFGVINFANADMVGHTGEHPRGRDRDRGRRRATSARSSRPSTRRAAPA